jgi:hypothetical protein
MSSINTVLSSFGAQAGKKLSNDSQLYNNKGFATEDYLLAASLHRSGFAKRAMNANRKYNKYDLVKKIQTPLLEHYENVDWYERETRFDYLGDSDSMSKRSDRIRI